MFPKRIVESADRFKSGRETHFRDGPRRFDEQVPRQIQSPHLQNDLRRSTEMFDEKSAQVAFGNAKTIRQGTEPANGIAF